MIYNAASQTTSLKIGADGANQITESYQYDDLTGLLANQKLANPQTLNLYAYCARGTHVRRGQA